MRHARTAGDSSFLTQMYIYSHRPSTQMPTHSTFAPNASIDTTSNITTCLEAAMHIVRVVDDVFTSSNLFRSFWFTQYVKFMLEENLKQVLTSYTCHQVLRVLRRCCAVHIQDTSTPRHTGYMRGLLQRGHEVSVAIRECQ